MEQMDAALLYLGSNEAADTITIVRFKDRFSKPTKGGWTDVALNFYFKVDRNRHRCELQLVHKKMMAVREGMDEHEEYEQFRAAAAIVEVFGGNKYDIL